MKALKLLLAVALGLAVLLPAAAVSAQSSASTFEEAEGPEDTCELQLLAGGPYEVSIDGSAAEIFENDSVVPVPQGSSVRYLRVERTIGSTAIGVNEVCAEFVGPVTDNDGASAPSVVVAGIGVLVGLGMVWWFFIGSKPTRNG